MTVTPEGPLKVGRDTKPVSLAKSLSLTILERESRVVVVRGIGPAAAKVFAEAWEMARVRLLAQGFTLAVDQQTTVVVEAGKPLHVSLYTCTAAPV